MADSTDTLDERDVEDLRAGTTRRSEGDECAKAERGASEDSLVDLGLDLVVLVAGRLDTVLERLGPQQRDDVGRFETLESSFAEH